MDENIIQVNKQGVRPTMPTPSQASFVSRYRKPLFWILLVILMFLTWYFSRSIEARGVNSAATFLSGAQSTDTIGLYANRADPAIVSIPVGSSVEFVVKDGSRHDVTERKSSSRRGDARIASGEFGLGESYSVQFNTPGVFSFYDRMNQDISIEVEVR